MFRSIYNDERNLLGKFWEKAIRAVRAPFYPLVAIFDYCFYPNDEYENNGNISKSGGFKLNLKGIIIFGIAALFLAIPAAVISFVILVVAGLISIPLVVIDTLVDGFKIWKERYKDTCKTLFVLGGAILKFPLEMLTHIAGPFVGVIGSIIPTLILAPATVLLFSLGILAATVTPILSFAESVCRKIFCQPYKTTASRHKRLAKNAVENVMSIQPENQQDINQSIDAVAKLINQDNIFELYNNLVLANPDKKQLIFDSLIKKLEDIALSNNNIYFALGKFFMDRDSDRAIAYFSRVQVDNSNYKEAMNSARNLLSRIDDVAAKVLPATANDNDLVPPTSKHGKEETIESLAHLSGLSTRTITATSPVATKTCARSTVTINKFFQPRPPVLENTPGVYERLMTPYRINFGKK